MAERQRPAAQHVVCVIGASYVTSLTGGGRLTRAVVGALLLLIVLALAADGLRASATAQLLMVSLLVSVIVAAIAGSAGSAGSARAANRTPFAPHGWLAIGHAAVMATVALTLGTTNAYINGAAAMARELTGARLADRRRSPFLAAIAASGLFLITLYGFGLVSPAAPPSGCSAPPAG